MIDALKWMLYQKITNLYFGFDDKHSIIQTDHDFKILNKFKDYEDVKERGLIEEKVRKCCEFKSSNYKRSLWFSKANLENVKLQSLVENYVIPAIDKKDSNFETFQQQRIKMAPLGNGVVENSSLENASLKWEIYRLIATKVSQLNKVQIYQLNIDLSIVKKHQNIEAAIESGFNKGSIERCTSLLSTTHKNYLWISKDKVEKIGFEQFSERLFTLIESAKKLQPKPVHQMKMNKAGKLVKVGSFDSAIAAARHFGDISNSHINSVLKGRRKTAYGFYWVYAESPKKKKNKQKVSA